MSAALFIVAALVYLFVVGFIFQQALWWRKRQCSDCARSGWCIDMHEVPAFFIAIAWPVSGFLVGGVLVSSWLGSREERSKSKHARKMAELEAESKLMRENIAFLKANGVNADIEAQS